jgi:hypothetical protein
MSNEAQLKKNLDYILKDFAPDLEPKEIFKPAEWNLNVQVLQQYEIQHTVLDVRFHPYIVFIIFVYIKKFGFGGRWEKVAWEIPVLYKGFPFILTHQKFGFRILSNTDSEEVTSLAIEAMQQINKAISIAEVLITPIIENEVKSKNLTLPNDFNSLESRYKYFRKQADKKYKIVRQYIPMKLSLSISTVPTPAKAYRALDTGKYYVSALLDAYFSMLENFLVLALPFINSVDLSTLNIEGIIRANWKDKFKLIFDFGSDVPAMKMYEKLIKLKEDLRNPFSHGYFLSGGQSIFVHMPHLGAIPMRLTQTSKKLNYRVDAIPPQYENICSVLDESLLFISKHQKTKFAYMYLKSGLSIAYDEKSVFAYRGAATKSMSLFKEFIKYMSWQHDNAANMDW